MSDQHAEYVAESICRQIGRCAYDAAAELMGGKAEQGCPWWSDCFGQVVHNDGTDHG